MKRALLLVLAVIAVGCVDAETRARTEQGDVDSQHNLGVSYSDGIGVLEDDAEGARWWRLAAEQGGADSQYSLGLMYARGDGVPEDMVLAYMWWNLAVAQGHELAQETKDMLEEVMTREQIAEGQRLSTEWIEAHPPGGD